MASKAPAPGQHWLGLHESGIRDELPDDARLSATFGNPGEGGYAEYWRTPDGQRFRISNGRYGASQPFTWTFEHVND